MIELIQMLALAVVQGLTEFLPVSSSGHLVLTHHWLHVAEGDVFLDVLLHVGTLGSVVCVYHREIRRLLRFDAPSLRYLLGLAVGTLPAVAVGLLAKDLIEQLFGRPVYVGGALLVVAAVLFSTRFIRQDETALPADWQPRPIPLLKALLVGVAQAIAIVPGISRSGSTIATSLWLGIPRAEAARFSFLLSIPAIGGALVLQILDGAAAGRDDWLGAVLAAVAAFAVGLLAIRWTALAVVQAHFWKFSVYCLVLGVVVLAVLT